MTPANQNYPVISPVCLNIQPVVAMSPTDPIPFYCSPSLTYSPLHSASSRFNTSHDPYISTLQLPGINDTAFSFFDIDMLSLRPPVLAILWDAAVALWMLVHHRAALIVLHSLFVPMCEAKLHDSSIRHHSYFVAMLGVSKPIKSQDCLCRGVKLDHSHF